MTVTISFRVSEELEEYLERRAKAQMTTKSTVAQMLLAERVRNERRRSRAKTTPNNTKKRSNNTEERSNNTEERSNNTEERTRKELDSMAEFQFGSKTLADKARQEFPEYLSDEDDKRLKKVRFEAGTPGKIVEELERRNVNRLK